MTSYPKIAVTLPPDVFAGLERARRRLGKTRSAAIALAVEDWLRMVDRDDAERRYAAGYERQPEADLAWADAASVGSSWGAWNQRDATRGSRADRRSPAVFRIPIALFWPSSVINRWLLAVFRIVPPRCMISETEDAFISYKSPSISPS